MLPITHGLGRKPWEQYHCYRPPVMPRASTNHHLRQIKSLITIAAFALLLLTGCAHVVPLVPDGKWHSVYGLQAADKQVQIEVERSSRCNSKSSQTPTTRTDIRVVQIESFQKLDDLPETLADAKPRDDGIPTKVADSGPYDMTLRGSRRILSLITGKQLVVRTWDANALLKLRIREQKTRETPTTKQ